MASLGLMFPSKYVSQVSARICERRPGHRLDSNITPLYLVYQESLATIYTTLFGLPAPQICETINLSDVSQCRVFVVTMKVNPSCTVNSKFHQTRKEKYLCLKWLLSRGAYGWSHLHWTVFPPTFVWFLFNSKGRKEAKGTHLCPLSAPQRSMFMEHLWPCAHRSVVMCLLDRGQDNYSPLLCGWVHSWT